MESTSIFQVLTVRYPQIVHMGPNSLQKLGPEAKELGGTRVLVVTDRGLVAAGIAAKVEQELNKSGLEVHVFSDFEPNPSIKTINDCAVQMREKRIDLVVGAGGGSSLDIAKAVAILGTNPGNFEDYLGLHNIPRPGLPKILIPTTAGSGSEASQAVVLKDEQEGIKKVAYSRHLLANTVILDPVLTISLPRVVTVDSGLDALITAIEHYVALMASPATDIAALEAIRLTAANLRAVYANGSNIEARYNMLLGSYFAGVSSAAGLGGIHALAYPLESKFHFTHGRANAIVAPYVLEFNRIGNLAKFSAIAEAMGESVHGLTLVEASKKAVSAMREILNDLGVSTKLRDYNIPQSAVPEMAEMAVKSGSRLLKSNPRLMSVDDIEDIYNKAW